jgi:hypothetical protein
MTILRCSGALAAAVLVVLVGCGGDGGASPSGSGPDGGGGSGATGASGPTTGGGPGSGGSGASTGPGGGGGTSFMGVTRVDAGAGNARDGSADVAVAPDGTIYVSWVTASDDTRVARSTDGGMTFEAAVGVDGPSNAPIVTMARHPRIVADEARVAVTFNRMDTMEVLLYVADAATLSFQGPMVIGGDVPSVPFDFAKPVLLADGSIGVAFQAYPQTGARIYLARENNGYASEVASGGAPGVPCECCPLDVVTSDEGNVMVAFRNNDNNDRDMWVSQAPTSGAFSSWVQASNTEILVPQCPMQGPRLAQLAPGTHAMVWSARDTNPGDSMISISDDGGATWSGGTSIGGPDYWEPTIALGSSGTLYVTAVTGQMSSSLVTSNDGGATFSGPTALMTPDGALSTPQAIGQGGAVTIAGVSAASTVWLFRVE